MTPDRVGQVWQYVGVAARLAGHSEAVLVVGVAQAVPESCASWHVVWLSDGVSTEMDEHHFRLNELRLDPSSDVSPDWRRLL